MRRIFKALFGLIAIALCLGLVLVFNAVRLTPEPSVIATRVPLGADPARAVDLLSEAIRIRTVSTDLSRPAFPEFVAFLERSFPRVHATMERRMFASNTPLFRWEGTDPGLPPVMLAAHFGVVPVDPATADAWAHPAFDGVVADGQIWGRGALDNKSAVIAILSAAEHLIGAGVTPERTVYLAIGGDEEVGGRGAQAVRDHLIAEGIRPAWVLDEGSMVFEGARWRVERPVASINVAEKGYLTVTLSARHEGGHSSSPPLLTAAGRIARAVDRVQSTPFRGKLDGVVKAQFTELAPHYGFRERLLLANLWLMSPVFEGILAGSPGSNALLRTTIAPTVISGGSKDNVLPTEARAVINFRLHPRDTIDGVLAHLVAAIDDPAVGIEVDRTTAIEASPVSDHDTQGFRDIAQSLRAVFGDIIVTPGLSIGATDSRFYAEAADATYRINPFLLSEEDSAGFHGPNERLSVANLEAALDFYGMLLRAQ